MPHGVRARSACAFDISLSGQRFINDLLDYGPGAASLPYTDTGHVHTCVQALRDFGDTQQAILQCAVANPGPRRIAEATLCDKACERHVGFYIKCHDVTQPKCGPVACDLFGERPVRRWPTAFNHGGKTMATPSECAVVYYLEEKLTVFSASLSGVTPYVCDRQPAYLLRLRWPKKSYNSRINVSWKWGHSDAFDAHFPQSRPMLGSLGSVANGSTFRGSRASG